MQIDVSFPVDQKRIGARVRELLQKRVRIRNHQVRFERQPCHGTERCHDRCSHRKVRREMAIHHVNVDAVRACLLRFGQLRAEPGEIRSKNGRGDFHLLPSKVSTNSR